MHIFPSEAIGKNSNLQGRMDLLKSLQCIKEGITYNRLENETSEFLVFGFSNNKLFINNTDIKEHK